MNSSWRNNFYTKGFYCFKYAILFVNVMSTFVKYLLHTIDLQNENPWENKGIVMLYADLVLGFARVLLYLTFMSLMVKIHTFPLFAIRPMYLSLRSFKKSLNDVIMSRRAIRNLNIMYPDVTAEQLRNYSDTICIICREEMSSPPGATDNNPQQIKKLPCDHIFHKSCLRSWFQRQQTCPTCRTSILRITPQQQQQPQQQAGNANQPGGAQAQAAAANNQQPAGQQAPGANIVNELNNLLNNVQPLNQNQNQFFNNLFANLPQPQQALPNGTWYRAPPTSTNPFMASLAAQPPPFGMPPPFPGMSHNFPLPPFGKHF
jgi:E3 ubiquitin-protein ligase synoviolin